MSDHAEPSQLAADDPRLEAWRTFLVAHARVSRRLDEELRAEQGLSLPEYEALLQIARAPGARLRMHQLAELVLLSRSGITRLIDRLEGAGLVERCSCTVDARGAEAVLTAAGLQRLRAASRTHLRGIHSYFLSVVDPADLVVVERCLGGVAARVTEPEQAGLAEPVRVAEPPLVAEPPRVAQAAHRAAPTSVGEPAVHPD